MSFVQVAVARAAVEPGDPLVARVTWNGATLGATIAVSLLWSTAGRGTEDVAVVARETIPLDEERGEREVQFVAPSSPWSFSGRLITLQWAVEATVEPGGWTDRAPVTIAPGASEILLGETK